MTTQPPPSGFSLTYLLSTIFSVIATTAASAGMKVMPRREEAAEVSNVYFFPQLFAIPAAPASKRARTWKRNHGACEILRLRSGHRPSHTPFSSIIDMVAAHSGNLAPAALGTVMALTCAVATSRTSTIPNVTSGTMGNSLSISFFTTSAEVKSVLSYPGGVGPRMKEGLITAISILPGFSSALFTIAHAAFSANVLLLEYAEQPESVSDQSSAVYVLDSGGS
mmetsp:Transcript_28787/g.59010  ORF Transcript_28787/g.59010 Transcript_28787/m.59010 type:complete len:223 (+) Transcript_28787:110-778(+)